MRDPASSPNQCHQNPSGAACTSPSLVGRDPWTQSEAYSFGIIRNMVRAGDPVVVTLAGLWKRRRPAEERDRFILFQQVETFGGAGTGSSL